MSSRYLHPAPLKRRKSLSFPTSAYSLVYHQAFFGDARREWGGRPRTRSIVSEMDFWWRKRVTEVLHPTRLPGNERWEKRTDDDFDSLSDGV